MRSRKTTFGGLKKILFWRSGVLPNCMVRRCWMTIDSTTHWKFRGWLVKSIRGSIRGCVHYAMHLLLELITTYKSIRKCARGYYLKLSPGTPWLLSATTITRRDSLKIRAFEIHRSAPLSAIVIFPPVRDRTGG